MRYLQTIVMFELFCVATLVVNVRPLLGCDLGVLVKASLLAAIAIGRKDAEADSK